jgi:AcrR family transcriptional regulator
VHGFDDTTLHSIAESVGLSESGVLHYFSSMNDLYIQILEARDRIQAHQLTIFATPPQEGESEDDFLRTLCRGKVDMAELMRQVIAINGHNQETPGLVELYVHMQMQAGNPQHPAHAYFLRRTAMTHHVFEPLIRQGNDQGMFSPPWDPAIAVSTMIAVADGLQLQWLNDHSVDVARGLTEFFQQIGIHQ